MTIQYKVYRSFLKDPYEIKDIEYGQANTTKIIDYVLKNATLKREFADTCRYPDNWLFDIPYSISHVYAFRFDGRVINVRVI